MSLFRVSSAKEEGGEKSEAFYLGCTTLILHAFSQTKKQNFFKREKGRVSLFPLLFLIHYITH